MNFKDLFSGQASSYARFRPRYPAPLFTWLGTLAPGRALAVDVGSGNGQAATDLAAEFARVVAIDPSASQLAHGEALPNLEYRKAAAEETGLDEGSADLVVAAQAFHWFDHPSFFSETRRILRPGGALAIWCYGLAAVTPELDALVHELYEKELGAYWEPERRLVESGYRTIAVPFAELPVPDFTMEVAWTLPELVGYLGTWSALRHYLEKHAARGDAGDNPLERMFPRLERAWGPVTHRRISWPLGLRAFRL